MKPQIIGDPNSPYKASIEAYGVTKIYSFPTEKYMNDFLDAIETQFKTHNIDLNVQILDEKY